MEYHTTANSAPMRSRYIPPHDLPSDYDSMEENDGADRRYSRSKRPYYVSRRGMMRERAHVMYYPHRRRPRTLSGHYVYEDYLTDDEKEEMWIREREEMEHGYAYYPRYSKMPTTQPMVIRKRYVDGAVRMRPPRDRSQSPTLSGFKRRRKESIPAGSREDASEHSNQDTTLHDRDEYDPGGHNAESEEHYIVHERSATTATVAVVEEPRHADESKSTDTSDRANSQINRPRSTSSSLLEREHADHHAEANALHEGVPTAESNQSHDDQPVGNTNHDDPTMDGDVSFGTVAVSSSLAIELEHTDEQVAGINNNNASDEADPQHQRLPSVTSAVDFKAVDNEATRNYSVEPCDAEFDVTMESGEQISKQVIKSTSESVQVVDVAKNDTISANCLLIASLERTNRVVAEWISLQQKVKSREQSYRLRSHECHLLQQLRRVCIIANDLQSWIVGLSGTFPQSVKTSMVLQLDAALQQVSRSKKTLTEKLQLLQREVDSVIASQTIESERKKLDQTPRPDLDVTMTPVEEQVSSEEDHSCEFPQFDDDKWETSDEEHHDLGISDSDQDANHHFMITPKQEHIKLEPRDSHMKNNLASVPSEVPAYLTSFLTQVEACDPSSFAMKGMQKRLLGEIVKMNPYYYLQPGKAFNAEENPTWSPCEFGCRGGSAGKWERKVISQISSRMKWFDSIAYSLAKTNGSNGKELLTRKKLNSTIRKLHLVAMQLHCLVSHLYCLREHSSCKELDSLPVALNNSQHERRMNGYKSRLKLVVNQLQQNGSAPEELLRDTYEFFPELLVCIDIWGYDFRESKHNVNTSCSSNSVVLPLGFFAAVEGDQFDYEQDANGYLQGICDELLNIVCLWNDFKWGESFDSMPVDRIVAFEADVKKSVLRILDSHSHHLLALWSHRLMEDPDQLAAFRLTQHNVYYVDNSHARGLVGKSVLQATDGIQTPGGPQMDLDLVQDYWKQKSTSEASEATPYGSLATPLSPKSITQWPRDTMATHLMKWSQVYALRTESQVLSSVMSNMLQDGSLVGKASTTSANRKANAGDLLASVRRARIVASDCVLASDKLALHYAASQLNDCEVVTEPALGRIGSHSVEQASEVSGSSQAPLTPDNQSLPPVESNGQANSTSDRPDVTELVTILTSTRKEVDTLCTQRTRSARVRQKLQSQSVQLAEQSLALLRNIAHDQQL